MSLANSAIVLSADPKGHWIEGVILGTPKPGTCVSLVAGQTAATIAALGGMMQYEPWAGSADGEQDEVIVLDADWMQGKGETDAYVTGDRCFMYMPVSGDELKVLFGNATGTADDVAIGGKLIIDNGTGKAIPTTGSPEMEPFKALEAITDPTADQLLHVRYTGH